MATRLNKLLSTRGIGARRKCDAIIAEGRVRVNGRLVSEPGTIIEEQRDRVEVDGRPLPKAQKHSYFVINKPVGVITTLDDPQGRRTIAEFLPRGQRLYPVGRLDADTSGLLLLTNDGELAHRLMHPRYGVEKVYRVRLDREPGARALERLARGVEFERGVVSAPARVRRIDPGFDAIMIEVAIHEGRYRQVRRMCEAVGLVVTGLHRVGYGPVRLGPLARGVWRELSDAEVEKLRAASARPLRRAGPWAAAERAARPERPPRGLPPAAARRTPASAGDDDQEDRWIPGGGFASDRGEANEWPARTGHRRGDEAFRESGTDRADHRESREPRLPWHAPEYRRGTADRAARGERAAHEVSRPLRRDERGSRGDFSRPRRDGGAPRGESRRLRRDAPSPRRDERGSRGDFSRPRRDGGAPRGESRRLRRDAPSPRRDERGSRGDRAPGIERAGHRPLRARAGEARGEGAGDRGRAGPRSGRRDPGRERGNAKSGRARPEDSRAFSPRSKRGPGAEGARTRRGRPDGRAEGRHESQRRRRPRPRNR